MVFSQMAKIVVIAGMAAATSAQALTITEVVPGQLTAFSWSIAGTIITIDETWGPTTPGAVSLRFSDLSGDPTNYTIFKNIRNNTGATWESFGHELLDNQSGPSNDNDGLSFAQGAGIPRLSTNFSNVLVDEFGTRDYLNWFTGSVLNNQTVTFQYGLRNSASVEPFLLRQTANVPEPASWALLIIGFGVVGGVMRRRGPAIA